MRFLSGSVLSGLVLATAVVNGRWVKGGLAGGRTMATRLCEPAALFRPRLKLEVLEAGTQLAPSQLGLQRPICCPHLYPTIQPRFTFSREYRAEHRDEHITAALSLSISISIYHPSISTSSQICKSIVQTNTNPV